MNLHSLKKYVLPFFTLLLFINCSNDEKPIPENALFEPQTELISLTGNNSQLKLTWKPVVIEKFKKFQVYRFDSNTDEYTNPEVVRYSGKLVFETEDSFRDNFTDNEVPFNSFISYVVVTEYYIENTSQTALSINYLSYENKDLSFSITSLEKGEDGSLKLKWDEDSNAGFEKYTIYALNKSYLNNDEIFLPENIIKVSTNAKETTVSDAKRYLNENVFYAVTKVVNGKTIKCKKIVSIENPRSLKFRPGQTLKNPYNENEIIIISKEDGQVLFYNTHSLNKDKIDVKGQIFFCSIGNYNGVEDLYVPSIDGNVFVIDLVSHKIKETINLKTDYNILTAIPINNYILFVEKHEFADIGGMFVYNRTNDRVLNRNGSFGVGANAKLVNGKENYFFRLGNDGREYGSETALTQLHVNGDEVKTDFTFEGGISDSRLFALSPDKSYFVSTNMGYLTNVNYDNFTEVTTGKYSETLNLEDVKISADNKIYFAVPTISRIKAFEKNNFTTPIKQYETYGFPLLLEVFDNEIISINQLERGYCIENIAK
ncbi:hypothetical protein BD847_0229 [Flavobacterium cutihirudinis]|uniref:Uncharacterized protein n=1 Tax=Flavobacterium cutihirudinis TaxID=1265740 RepID=A0A3D9G151_9FLAO|nr:hypothetical protein [Flavobacterium cutihirudinis]RED26312.1 hypothetical protein BD847_0229 [Flavobacterium cutihirudinis]